jgi:hypothetical protein
MNAPSSGPITAAGKGNTVSPSFFTVEDIARWLETLARFEATDPDPSPYAIAADTIRQLLDVVGSLEQRLEHAAKVHAHQRERAAIEEAYGWAKKKYPFGLAGVRALRSPSQLDLFDDQVRTEVRPVGPVPDLRKAGVFQDRISAAQSAGVSPAHNQARAAPTGTTAEKTQ